MQWKESSVMDERVRFVARILEGEPMAEICREFGISRKTGYKIFNRYKDHGVEALSDRERGPFAARCRRALQCQPELCSEAAGTSQAVRFTGSAPPGAAAGAGPAAGLPGFPDRTGGSPAGHHDAGVGRRT